MVSQVDTTSFTVSSEGVKGVALALSFHHTRRIWKGWDTISGKGGMKIQRGRRRRCTEERPAVGYPSNKKNLEAPLQPSPLLAARCRPNGFHSNPTRHGCSAWRGSGTGDCRAAWRSAGTEPQSLTSDLTWGMEHALGTYVRSCIRTYLHAFHTR